MVTEKRLIDANALLYEYCQANGCNEVIDEICPNCFAAGLIESAPTVDAVEVVHGYTIPADQPKKVLLDRKCGICDSLMLSTDAYCPSCGAKMDGDENG